ncbi:(deoxy)nucleoside triphosphate pyrophosphohydrolase [Liquorilactobacillus uvarum]|uniref:(deoxy)nucleoside triphosphate pyrophosphohydrolase n=1 Tax=Liquorilactobacillus uvarum TaxID=303240 RepID=UPI00288C1B1C|nr:(deoxy)nucleoside triphosphate pyrophosphohydrolase [Liquorilactobacillus uvarum]
MKKEIYVVGAALLSDNRILAAKRKNNRTLGGMWEFPGGKIKENETPQAALKRELEEEFSDKIIIGPQAAVTASYEYSFGRVHLTVYYAKLLTQNFKLVAHSQIRWVRPSELRSLEWPPADLPIIEKITQTDLRRVNFDD